MPRQKEILSNWSGISLLGMFMMGTSIITMAGKDAGMDVLLALPMAAVANILLAFMYTRILTLYPGKSMMDLQEMIFGKLSKLFYLLTVWIALHVATMTLILFGEFIQVVSLPETPRYFICGFIAALAIWLVKDGLEVMGRWAGFAFPVFLLIITGVSLLSIEDIRLDTLGPFLSKGLHPLLTGTFPLIALGLAFFTEVFNHLGNSRKTFRVFLFGILLTTFSLFFVYLRNISVLGMSFTQSLYFPSYAAVGIINIGNFLQRIEVAVSVNFILVGFIRLSICLYVASKGISRLFGFQDHRAITAPVAFLVMAFTLFAFRNIVELSEWVNSTYPYYRVPFLFFLPLVTWVAGEIKARKDRRKATLPPAL